MAKKKPTKEEITRRRKKTISVKHLSGEIRGLRTKVTRDMKSDDEKTKLVATIIALIDCTAERVGNDASAKDANHVGVTGFKKENVKVNGNKVTLDYVGKSDVEHLREFTDERIATVLKVLLKRAKKPSDFIFTTSDGLKIKAPQVNKYLENYGVTAKDLRGYAANHMVIESLRKRKKPSDEKERKKVMSEVLQKVADTVGHGKATLRKHYLLPNIEDDYVKKGKIPSIKQASIKISSEIVIQKFYIHRIGKTVANKELARQSQPMVDKIRSFVNKTYKNLFNEASELPEKVELVVAETPKGKIGSYDYGDMILSISPDAFERGIVKMVVLHELAHAAIGNTNESDRHGQKFVELATALGIPKRYQD